MERTTAVLKPSLIWILICVLLMGSPSIWMSTADDSEDDNPNNYKVAGNADRSCVEAVVSKKVYAAVGREKRMAASLLRLHFHDCFVHGCDGSLLLDESADTKGEKFAPGNNNSVRGFELVDELKESITSQCKVRISCTDILALAARSGVQAVSPTDEMPSWDVTLGKRYDSKASYPNLTSSLPGTDEPMEVLLKKFAKQNITDVEDFVALIGGGHTIGLNHCSFVRRRLYGNNTSRLPSDQDYVKFLEDKCPEEDVSVEDVSIALDNSTQDVFDNGFFIALMKGRVSIKADQLLGDPANPPEMRDIVKTFTEDQTALFKAFGVAMEKMGRSGNLGPDEGEIRTNCRYPNSYK